MNTPKPEKFAVDFEGYAYTLPEAARISGVSEKNLRNWIDRKVLIAGQRHFLGRWMFNLLDCLRIHICNELISKVAMEPKQAANVAALDTVSLLVKNYISSKSAKTLKQIMAPESALMVAFIDGKWAGCAFNPLNPSSMYLESPNTVPAFIEMSGPGNAFFSPHVVVPVFYAISHLLQRAQMEIERRSSGSDDQ